MPDNITYEGDTITWSGTLAGDQADADMSVRYYAPGNDAYVPQTVFDASSFNHLKIQLGSTTDALLAIKLQPNPVPADGCTATAFVLVDSSMTELVLDLDAATFSLPDHCTGGTDVVAVKSALHAIDIVNPATAAGDHDFRVGNATFGY